MLRIDPDPAGGETPSAIPVSDPPDGITAYEGAVWIFSTAKGTVTRVDPDLNAADDPIPIHHRPIAIRPGLGAAWTVNEDGTITRISPGIGPKTLKVDVPVAAFTVDQPNETLWAVAR